MSRRKPFTSNRSPDYVNATYLDDMRDRWKQAEEIEKRKSDHVQSTNIARLENQKLTITKKIEQLDHSKARYLQSIRAIDEAIADLTGLEG